MFYFHDILYILLFKNEYNLCLYTLNEHDHMVEIICNLSLKYQYDRKSPIMINPHIPGVIYANLQINDNNTITVISFDEGKHFLPIELEGNYSGCFDTSCCVEFYLELMIESKEDHFPEKWMAIFQGVYHCNGSSRYHNFMTFNGGKTWRILDRIIQKFFVLNHGGLVFAIEQSSNIIWYSYDEGNNWYDDIRGDFKDVFPLESHNNLGISALNVNRAYNIHSFNKYVFSSVISILCLMTDRTCHNDDYEPWYIPRFYENCFRGEEAFYWKIKRSAMCFDNRTVLIPTFEPCQCIRDGFQWYSN
ncbi:Vacuolar protein sorting/targeting protein 10 [Thelohanellus kitauei]|uniref:Vacuolar protein sorting/targeting protein 10 n=1 Tax=Thelohanellus kitauei TaxID=669202 RepID=A0A0C2M9P6_THEKT|nr:Vacuolar protein sorting/targeting protein 10 [Thelohanellus kitauei]